MSQLQDWILSQGIEYGTSSGSAKQTVWSSWAPTWWMKRTCWLVTVTFIWVWQWRIWETWIPRARLLLLFPQCVYIVQESRGWLPSSPTVEFLTSSAYAGLWALMKNHVDSFSDQVLINFSIPVFFYVYLVEKCRKFFIIQSRKYAYGIYGLFIFFQEVSEATEVDWNAEAHFFINLIF